MAESPAVRAEEILRKAEERLAQLEAAGLDVRSLHKKLEKAKQLDADERYEDVIKTTEEILVVAKIARDEVQTSLTSIISKGKTQRKQLIDEKKVKEIVARSLQEEVDKFIHSKSLRAMLETIAREEAEDQVGRVSKVVEEIDTRTEKLADTVGTKADGAALDALQTSLDEQVSELATPEEISSTVSSLEEKLTGKIDGLPVLSRDDVAEIVEKALADAGYAVAADIAAELASTEDELGDRIEALSKEMKNASKKLDEKLSSMPKITEEDVDAKVEAKAEAAKAERESLKAEMSDLLSRKMEALEHDTNNKFLNLPRLSEDDAKRVASDVIQTAGLAASADVDSKLASLKEELENRLTSAPRLTEDDVKRIVAEVIEAAPKPETLTPEQVGNIVSERVDALDKRISDLPTTTPDEVNSVVADALRSTEFASSEDMDAKLASLKEELENRLTAAPQLTEDDVRRIAAEVVEAAPKPETLTQEQVGNMVSERADSLDRRISDLPTITPDEVSRIVADALRSTEFASIEDMNSKLASLKEEIENRLTAAPQLTEDDVKRIAAEVVEAAPKPESGPSSAQVENLVAEKIAGIEMPSSLSRADIENIVTEVLAQKLSPVESKLSNLESGLDERISALPTMSPDEVNHIVANALRSADFASASDIDSKVSSLRQEIETRAAAEPAGPSLSEDDVKRIAAEAVPKAEGGPSVEELEDLVSRKIAGIEIPSQRSRADIEDIITEVLAQRLSPLQSKLSALQSAQAEKEDAAPAEDLNAKIDALRQQLDQKISSMPTPLAKDDVHQIVRDTLAAQEAPAVSPEDISRIAAEKVAGILRTLREKLA